MNKYLPPIKALIVVSSFIVLAILGGFRPFGIDPDYNNYRYFYSKMPINYRNIDSRFEIGFNILTYAIKYIASLSFESYLIFISSISLGIKILFLYHRNYFFIIYLCYFFSIYFLHEMIQVRLSLAIAFGILTIFFQIKNKPALAYFAAFTSISFHVSMLFPLALIFLPKRLTEFFSSFTGIIFSSLILAFIVHFSFEFYGLLNPLASTYLLEGDSRPVNIFNINSASYLFMCAMGSLYIDKSDISILRSYLISVYSLLLFAIFALHATPVFAHRAFQLGFIFYLIWIPSLTNKYVRSLCLSVLLLTSFYSFLRNIFLEPLFV